MTPATPWHPGEELLQSYVDGGLPGLSASSVEAHLLTCGPCRAAVAEGVAPDRLSRVRAGLDDRLDVLTRPWYERMLKRWGLPEVDARALLAAPNLRQAWLLAVLATGALALLVMSNGHERTAVFLVLAPLVPLGTTAAAYAPSLDPAFSLVAATPYGTVRLLLARTLAVGCTSLVGVAAVALAVPERHLTGLVWLLPSLALTFLVLALAPRVGTGVAAWAVGSGWLAVVAGLHGQGVETSWIAGAAAQIGAGVLAALALAMLAHQWARFDLRGTT